MTLWFGHRPFGPMCTKQTHVDTPVGEPCLWCGDEIEAGECGVVVPMLLALDPETWVMRAHHQECFLRQTLGSVAHIERRCSCYVLGSSAEDPPDMTMHEAALAAVQAWLKSCRTN